MIYHCVIWWWVYRTADHHFLIVNDRNCPIYATYERHNKTHVCSQYLQTNKHTWHKLVMYFLICYHCMIHCKQVHWRKQDWHTHQKCLSWSTRSDSPVSLLSLSTSISMYGLSSQWAAPAILASLYHWCHNIEMTQVCVFFVLCLWFSSLANNQMRFLPRDLFFDLNSLLELWVSSCGITVCVCARVFSILCCSRVELTHAVLSDWLH